MSKLYRKKPVVVEVVQLTNYTIKTAYEFVYGKGSMDINTSSMANIDRLEIYYNNVKMHGMDIPTLEDGNDKRAKHVASIGDYIIKGVKGEFYPCKPNIFLLTYEAAEEVLHDFDESFISSCYPNGLYIKDAQPF